MQNQKSLPESFFKLIQSSSQPFIGDPYNVHITRYKFGMAPSRDASDHQDDITCLGSGIPN